MSLRSLSPQFLALMAARVFRPVLFAYAEFPLGTRYIWTGLGQVEMNGQVYTGVGGIISIDSIKEEVDSATRGISVKVDGLDDALIEELSTENYQGGKVRLDIGAWDVSTNEIIVLPNPLWKGVLDQDDMTFGRVERTVTLICESRQVDVLRKRDWKYTDKDQQSLYPGMGDTGLDKIEAMIDYTVPFGRKPT